MRTPPPDHSAPFVSALLRYAPAEHGSYDDDDIDDDSANDDSTNGEDPVGRWLQALMEVVDDEDDTFLRQTRKLGGRPPASWY